MGFCFEIDVLLMGTALKPQCDLSVHSLALFRVDMAKLIPTTSSPDVFCCDNG